MQRGHRDELCKNPPSSSSSSSSRGVWRRGTPKGDDNNISNNRNNERRRQGGALCTGVLVTLLPDGAFLRPNDPEREKRRDVWFPLRSRGSFMGLMPPRVGDVFEYMPVSSASDNKPRAAFARLLSCTPRPSSALAHYLNTLLVASLPLTASSLPLEQGKTTEEGGKLRLPITSSLPSPHHGEEREHRGKITHPNTSSLSIAHHGEEREHRGNITHPNTSSIPITHRVEEREDRGQLTYPKTSSLPIAYHGELIKSVEKGEGKTLSETSSSLPITHLIVEGKAVDKRGQITHPKASSLPTTHHGKGKAVEEGGETVLREITKCPAGILLALQQSQPSLDIVKAILELSLALSSHSMRLYSAQLRKFHKLFHASQFLLSPNALRKYIAILAVDSCGGGNDSKTRLVQPFLLTLAKSAPYILPSLMPLVHITIAEHTRGDFEFLLNIFKIASHKKGAPSDLCWDKIPLLPLRSELHQNASTPGHQQNQFSGLPLVIKKGSYGSAECYVDTYFRLLREDCFGNLKKGIREFQAGKLKNEDLKLWFNVYVMGVHFDRATPGITIALRCKTTGSRKTPKQGSLLCLSCDGGNLKSPIWAIVRNSGETKKNTVTFFVEVVEMKETEFEASRNSTFSTFFQLITFSDDMLFLESPTYFQAYEPVLCSLQTIDPKMLPFQEEIVHAQWPSIAPDYLMKSTSLDWSCLLKEEGTTVKEIRAGVYDFDKLLQQGFRTFLNDSQKEALQHVLKSRLAMIQGPPGTGKTFLGSKILQLLLSSDAFPNQPILIVTYKNQALDQLLEKCMKFFESPGRVVRVGGRSSSQKIEGVNMKHFLSKSKNIFSSDWMQNTKRLEEIQRDMEKLLQEVKTGLSIKIYSSCKWLKLAPEHFIYKLLSRRRNDRYLLQKIPEGESLSEVLLERSLLDSNIYKQLEKAMLENLKEWLPHKGVFRQVHQCFLSLKGLIDLSELENTTHSEGITRSQSGDSEDSDDDIEKKQSEMRNGSEKSRIDDWLKSNFVNFTIERNDMLFFGLGLEDLDSGLEQNLLFRIDPWKLSQEQRCIAVQMILKRNLEEVSRKVHGLKEEYNELCILNEEIDKRRKLDVLKQAKIIGMTTTGAAMHRDIIRILSPSIVLIEEAAEILEPQIIAVLNPGLQHLILIGDHYQLRPGVECYELEKLHDFGVSMFERLAEHNKLPFQALKMQSRMRDEFLPFLRPIYPDLQSNLECVSGSRNQVPTCMMTSMFFWTHSFKEKTHKSPENSGEADMVIALIMWLVAKGNDARTITVIAAYNGQVSLIRKIMKIHPGLHEVEVFTIDKFQGSENQIVIFSLVRSNNECKIGHLNIRNRLCVAVSRARSGLYICGNQKTLSRSPHWRCLIEHFDEQKCLGDIIMLKCPRHPSNPPLRLSSQDAQSFSPNLCKEPCNAYLSDCGHLCVGACHMGEHVKCDERVEHVFENCGHSTTKPCHQNPNEMKCNEVISFRFPTCGHIKICNCWELEIRTNLKCLLACTKTLLCGHPCFLSCHEACDLEHCKTCEKEERIKAMKEVELAKKEIMEKLQDIDVKLRQIKSNDSDQVVKKDLGNNDNVWEYNMVKDRFEKYIQVDHQFYPLIIKIEQVHNLNLRKKFLEAHWEMIDPTKAPQMLFHGTSSEAIDNIIRCGFKLPSKEKKNMYGRGIYFATDSSKSAQPLYTKGSKKLLLCEVLVGNALCVNKLEPELNLKKIRSRYYDSVYSERQSRATGGTLFDEYVVYDCRQAYPSYIISFDQVDIHSAKFWPSNPLWHHTDGAAFVRTSLKPSPDLFKNIIDEFHFRIAESQFLRMQLYHRKMKVVEVEVILNRELEARYEQQKQALMGRKDVKERLVFHGTTKEAIEKIIKEGFKVGGEGVEIRCGAAHGRGVYTATNPEISVDYAAGTSMMLLSKAVLGKLGKDYTSVGGNIYVIKKAEQLLPRYIIHYA